MDFNSILQKVVGFLHPQPQGPAISPLPEKDTLNTPGKLYYVNNNNFQEQQAKQPGVAVMGATDTAPTTPSNFADILRKGFLKFNANSPLATVSGSFEKAGQGLPDPYMPAVLALKETGAGTRPNPLGLNNPLNIGPDINYPSYDVALNGGGTWGSTGGPQMGFAGLMKNGMYDNYLKTKSLLDFFQTYTPWKDNNGKVINDSYDKQINDYNSLKTQYFLNNLANR